MKYFPTPLLFRQTATGSSGIFRPEVCDIIILPVPGTIQALPIRPCSVKCEALIAAAEMADCLGLSVHRASRPENVPLHQCIKQPL